MIFFYFLPAIGWGVMPLIAKLTRSKPINQLVGTTTAAVLVSLLFTFLIKPEFTNFSVMIAFVSGCFWAIGQYFQFYSFQFLPVSEAMPISNGTQLIGTTFVAAFFFPRVDKCFHVADWQWRNIADCTWYMADVMERKTDIRESKADKPKSNCLFVAFLCGFNRICSFAAGISSKRLRYIISASNRYVEYISCFCFF